MLFVTKTSSLSLGERERKNVKRMLNAILCIAFWRLV